MECLHLTSWRSVWGIYFVSQCVPTCSNTCLCVTVCVLQKEFMLFAVNTAHNGALNSEPLQAWANGVLRLPQMITPLCPQGQTSRVLTRRKNGIDPDSPKNNQINSICPLLAKTLCQSFETEKLEEKSALILWKSDPFCSCMSGRPLPSKSTVKC